MSEVQFNKVLSYIESGKDEGATLLTGGNRVGNKGYFIEPTIFGDVQVSIPSSPPPLLIPPLHYLIIAVPFRMI